MSNDETKQRETNLKFFIIEGYVTIVNRNITCVFKRKYESKFAFYHYCKNGVDEDAI